MMLGRMNRNARPVVREKNEDAPLWRMFCPDIKGKVVVLACEDGEEGFNRSIRNNSRVPDQAALMVELPQGKVKLFIFALLFFKQLIPDDCLLMNETQGILVPWGTLLQRVFPNSTCRRWATSDFANRRNHMSRLLFLLWCQRWFRGCGGSSVGVKPVDDKKRKGDAPVAGGKKGLKLRRTRTIAIPQLKPAVTTGKLIICYISVVIPDVTDRRSLFCVETREEPVSVFATPPSPSSIEVVTPPSVHAEDIAKKPAAQTIDDTLDSSNSLIDLHDKPKSPIAEKASGSTVAGTGVEDQPSIQPGETELEFYYRSYAVDRGLDYHRPLWTVMQGDDVSNDPSACRDMLRGLGTPFEVLRARETTWLRAEAEAMMKTAQEGAERLKKDRATFEKLKQTKTWAATVGLKQVRSLTKLHSDERKGWKEACARENEKLFRVLQELTNLKAANAALMKEKAGLRRRPKKRRRVLLRCLKRRMLTAPS
ncbi:hypothetical protein Hanom_Chr12g01175921 [Helianthus anomalus]